MGQLMGQFQEMGQFRIIGAKVEFLVCISFFAESPTNSTMEQFLPNLGNFGQGENGREWEIKMGHCGKKWGKRGES